jgi:signal transduction histidine kinase
MLALGVGLPTLLLALGWAFATYRERSLLEEQRRAEIEAMLGSLEQAVDESLEELRAREDERPYYVWGHYYSPPDVLSLTDPVAISPLATGPADPRVVGHFQLAADGRITTPYAEGLLDARTPRAPREEQLAGLLAPSLRTSLLAALEAEPPTEPAHDLEESGAPTYWASSTGTTTSSSDWGSPSLSSSDDDTPPARPVRVARREPAPTQRVEALELNSYGSQLAQEINLAQQGDPIVRNDLWERGRAAPQVARVTRSAPNEAEAGQSSAPSRRSAARDPEQRAAVVPELVAQAAPSDATRAPPIEVEYTPMRFDRLADVPVLVRTVSDGHNAYLQGVVLDDAYLEGTWLPRLVARFVVSEPAARLVSADDAAELAHCALTRALPIAPSRLVCVERGALVGAPTSWLTWIERGLLALLVLVVVLALRAVERAAREERALSRQKSQFVSAVSHELRTPLTTIRMHAEMLADDLVEAERRPRVHEELVGETVRLTRLVENVLEASRLEEGRRPIRPRTTDLRAHVAHVVSDLDRYARGKGFELAGPDDGEPIELSFDPGAIEQVVVNLVDNAIKYTGAGERRIEIALEAEAAHARIVVRDRGEGIPPHEKARVFERFHRIERAAQAHQPGTGLGLSIVRELVTAHGGTVVLRDRAPRGLEVVVTLPRVSRDEA